MLINTEGKEINRAKIVNRKTHYELLKGQFSPSRPNLIPHKQ